MGGGSQLTMFIYLCPETNGARGPLLLDELSRKNGDKTWRRAYVDRRSASHLTRQAHRMEAADWVDQVPAPFFKFFYYKTRQEQIPRREGGGDICIVCFYYVGGGGSEWVKIFDKLQIFFFFPRLILILIFF